MTRWLIPPFYPVLPSRDFHCTQPILCSVWCCSSSACAHPLLQPTIHPLCYQPALHPSAATLPSAHHYAATPPSSTPVCVLPAPIPLLPPSWFSADRRHGECNKCGAFRCCQYRCSSNAFADTCIRSSMISLRYLHDLILSNFGKAPKPPIVSLVMDHRLE